MHRNHRFPTTQQSRFAHIPQANIQRSTFDRSHAYKGTFDGGILYPVFIDEVLPGDTFNLKMNHFIRMTTPIVPFMDNSYIDVHCFFTPNRLVWDNWEKFCGAQDNPDDSTDFLIPKTVAVSSFASETLADYFGIPTGVAISEGVNSLPFRCYRLIWNEWYRDENLQDSVTVPKGNGPDPFSPSMSNVNTLLRRGKRKDYFTSALPWPQKGPAVEIPIGGFAPVIGDASTDLQPVFDGAVAGTSKLFMSGSNPSEVNANLTGTTSNFLQWNDPKLVADLSNATSVTINSLRQSFQIQRLFERDARGGTRYTELLLAHFGVTNPDFRLQRPEYLGGYSSRISVNPVAQTSESTAQTPQGNLAAVAHSAGGKTICKQSFTEHGYVMVLLSIRADLTYQQGLNKLWSRNTRFDIYYPSLAHLGEQAILNKEIYTSGDNVADNEVFGYQERWAEMRYKPSQIVGQFRSNFAQSLDIWHLSQDFSSLPVLNASFIQENPPFDRAIAVPTYPQFFGDFWFDFKCHRPMPVYSVPGMIDHF